jgi:glycosyltransferase 2 family protein
VRSLTAERIRVRRRADAAAALVGLGILAVGMLIVGDGGVVPDAEEAVFWSINDLPGWLYPLTWPVQQLGVLAIGPVVAVIALLTGHRRLAAAAVIATVAKLVLERVVKAMVSRGRPWRSIGPDVELRGDVSMVGEAFVSGHAIMAGAMAALVSPYLPGRWRFVPWVLAVLVLLARIYVGAHNPLDVLCGAALGVAVASCLHLAFGVPARRVA